MAIEGFLNVSLWQTLQVVIAASILWTIWLLLYRLHLSPIANVPGSRLAAATGWVETYYDFVRGGRFIFTIGEWHKQYGPIIRISPWEVHIVDPDFFDEVYSPKATHSKLAHLSKRLNIPQATSEIIDPEEHRRRRAVIAPFFTKGRVYDFSSYIQSRADKLCSILKRDYVDTNKPVNIGDAWSAFTTDTITWYSLAMSYEFLDKKDFRNEFETALKKFTKTIHLVTQFPFVSLLLAAIPKEWLGPDMAAIRGFFAAIEQQIVRIMSGENDVNKLVSHRTIFHELLQSSTLRPEEKTLQLLSNEAQMVTMGGIDTSKLILTNATFNILHNPSIHAKLRHELETAIPDPDQIPPLKDLERLPYLTAIILESLRTAHGVSQRLFRTNTTQTLTFQNYTLPPGTVFSMSIPLQHWNETIFPSPRDYIPERWLDNPTTQNGRPLTKYLVSFGKGQRMCAGMNLAWAEMYIGLATTFRNVNMRLFETGRDDVEMESDYFLPCARKGSKGVRITVHSS